MRRDECRGSNMGHFEKLDPHASESVKKKHSYVYGAYIRKGVSKLPRPGVSGEAWGMPMTYKEYLDEVEERGVPGGLRKAIEHAKLPGSRAEQREIDTTKREKDRTASQARAVARAERIAASAAEAKAERIKVKQKAKRATAVKTAAAKKLAAARKATLRAPRRSSRFRTVGR